MKGFVVKFDKKKGFGFIRPEQGEDYFVHINDVDNGAVLSVGQEVSFDTTKTDKGPAAVNVKPGRKRKSPFAIFGIMGLVVALSITVLGKMYLPFGWPVSYLIGINFAVFALYGYDKMVAGKGRLRVPEMVLHLYTFLGGTPMAFGSQYIFRHKTVKKSFRIVFWLIFVAQIIAVWKLWPLFSK